MNTFLTLAFILATTSAILPRTKTFKQHEEPLSALMLAITVTYLTTFTIYFFTNVV